MSLKREPNTVPAFVAANRNRFNRRAALTGEMTLKTLCARLSDGAWTRRGICILSEYSFFGI